MHSILSLNSLLFNKIFFLHNGLPLHFLVTYKIGRGQGSYHLIFPTVLFISFPAEIIRILFLVSLTEAIGEKAAPVYRLHQDFLQRMSRHRHGKIKFTDNGLPFSVVTIIAVSDQYKAVKSGVT
jgi:hypothetical protein